MLDISRGAGITGAVGAAAPLALVKIAKFFYFPIALPKFVASAPTALRGLRRPWIS